MTKVSIIVFYLFFLSCHNKRQVIVKSSSIEDEILNLASLKDSKTTLTVNTIPRQILDSLSLINKAPFLICDDSKEDKINFSDTELGQNLCPRKLNFSIFNDSIYLLIYREGGIGRHDVVDYFSLKPKYFHKKYSTIKRLDNKDSLIIFIRNLKVGLK